VYGDPVEGVAKLSWADRLAEALRPLHPDFKYHNLAQRGKTSAQIASQQQRFYDGLRTINQRVRQLGREYEVLLLPEGV
jgi:hypothetical protein